jgi:hypothetical protein
MALLSPGVEVSVIDEAQYLPSPSGSIPFFLIATAQNKADPTSTRVAQGTTAANAGKLYRVTSQRELVQLYGNPFFYTTTNGTPIQGYELNEYGLLAAYSALGLSNSAYVIRADVNLAGLIGQTGRPAGLPTDGTYWLNTTTSTWGIYEFNQTTNTFRNKLPIVISDSDLVAANKPIDTLGAVGSYAVIAIPDYGAPTAASSAQYFYKNSAGEWVIIGSKEWLNSWPIIQSTQSNPTLTPGDTVTLNVSGNYSITATVQAAPNNLVSVLVNDLTAYGVPELTFSLVSGKLTIYSAQLNGDISVVSDVTISGTGTLLADLGITAGTYNQPGFFMGTSSQQPLWAASQTYPRPTGSVWIKVGAAGNGFVPSMSRWDGITRTWNPKTITLGLDDWTINSAFDIDGGKNIPANTIYAQWSYDSTWYQGPIYFWERLATGPTIVTGTNTSPSFTNGPYTATINISLPGSSVLSIDYTLTLADNTNATDFVNAWIAAGIPFTTAEVLSNGAIQLTHTEGGVIIVNDVTTGGVATDLMSDAGFIIGSTTGMKYGQYVTTTFAGVAITGGSGASAAVTVTNENGIYTVDAITNGGSGYVAGDNVSVAGNLLGGSAPTNNLVLEVVNVNGSGAITGIAVSSGSPNQQFTKQLSNWVEFDYTPNEGAPTAAPANGTNWYYSVENQVDIMVNTSGGWVGYKNINYDNNGFPTPTGVNATDPAGPIVSASEPTLQSDGTALVYGDIWIDTSDLENYPIIRRWQLVDTEDRWVLIDNTDQTTGSGVVFADARWAQNGTVNPVNDPIPSIVTLLTSNYLDLDAPSPDAYPVGMLLFNTRRSGFNVKQYNTNYFNNVRFPDETLPSQKDAWVTISGNQTDGAPYMGRKAQRAVVVASMRRAIDTNTNIRDEDFFFNLIACPNYPELQPNMIVLNSDRAETAFIVGDTPMRLPDTATAIEAWATNTAGAAQTSDEGLVTRNSYMGLFYPSGLATDFTGNLVAVPPSHMMVRTLLRNDQIAYPWFAPAGTRRGVIDNATSLGYVSPTTGEFVTTRSRMGIRDTLYVNMINPLVFFTGQGLLNYGNKTSLNSLTALDRINVARLVAYIRRQLTLLARPFIFEPNDAFTRSQVQNTISALMNELVALRGIIDYSVVCDGSNNTPARIERSELWVDVAIQPLKAVEFIYIPVRITNTGEALATAEA